MIFGILRTDVGPSRFLRNVSTKPHDVTSQVKLGTDRRRFALSAVVGVPVRPGTFSLFYVTNIDCQFLSGRLLYYRSSFVGPPTRAAEFPWEVTNVICLKK
jgi:hypothetical protein